MSRFLMIPLSAAAISLLAPAPAILVPQAELLKRIATPDPSLRILDTRDRADYDKGHIPGAVWVDVKAASALAARPGGLADAGAWSAWITPLGIDDNSNVLIYDGERQLEAARVWWLLRYLGVDKAGLIDGNYAYWLKNGGLASTESTMVDPKPFRIKFRPDRHATREEVLAALEAKSIHVIDARSEAEHTGAAVKSKRGGHIPTACHLEWTDFVGTDGRFLDESALRSKIAKVGLKPGEAVVTHCQGGGRASVDAFVFERLGHPAKNYYLGWSDWGNVDNTPVSKGKEPAQPEPKP